MTLVDWVYSTVEEYGYDTGRLGVLYSRGVWVSHW